MLLSMFLRAVFAEVPVFNLVEVLAAEPQPAAVALIAPICQSLTTAQSWSHIASGLVFPRLTFASRRTGS